MPGDRKPEVVRLGHDGAEFVEGELACGQVGSRRHRAAAGHHLDDVGAVFRAITYRVTQTVHTGGLATHHGAMSADGGDRRAGADDRRRGRVAAAGERRVVDVAEVAHGCHAGSEMDGTGVIDDRGEPLVVQFAELVERARAAVAAEVDVRVNQAGKSGGAGKVHDRAAFRHRGLHACDVTVGHQYDRCTGDHPFAVEHSIRAICLHGRFHAVTLAGPASTGRHARRAVRSAVSMSTAVSPKAIG